MCADLLKEGSVLIAQGCTPEHCASHQAGTIQMLIFATVCFLLLKLPVSEEWRFFFLFTDPRGRPVNPAAITKLFWF